MFNIHSIMLLLLGFSLAGLVVCLLAPLYAGRAARLAVEALKKTIPTTQEEIQAEKDMMRAQYALEIHDLQMKVHRLSLKGAHQKVDINKREAHVQSLEKKILNLNRTHLEHENARRVLEVSITERIPRIEERLHEARKLLDQRDLEISALMRSAEKQAEALQEATQINAQQRAEIESLNAKLIRRNSKTRESASERDTEVQFALRSEIHTLRARLKDQAQTLALLQKNATSKAASEGEENRDPEAEMKRLSRILADAEKTFQSSLTSENTERERLEALEGEILQLKAQNADQYSIIQDLRAEIIAKDKHTLQMSLQASDEITHQGLAQRLAFVSETLNKAPAGPPSQRPSLTELVTAPKSANTHSGETSIHKTGHNEFPHISHETGEIDGSEEEQENNFQKKVPRSGLLQRISNIEKPTT